MGVFFRTGDNVAVGVSWPVYVFFVLPAQAVWLLVKALVFVYAAVAFALVVICRWAYGQWRDHKESRPPAA